MSQPVNPTKIQSIANRPTINLHGIPKATCTHYSDTNMCHSRDRNFGQKGNDALLKELQQLHIREGMVPKRK